MDTTQNKAFGSLSGQPRGQLEVLKVRYCLYARKSTESEERQVLSIDSQIKEMLLLAEREGLEIVAMKRESHSAKETGQRPIFNEIVLDIQQGKFNGILTWAPDRISRNAGDLGKIVDLMDQKLLLEIRTYGQRFTNNPNEKFLLMILGSQAKLENDNRGINVKRGLRTRVEMGLWPGMAPVGYLNQKLLDKKCQVIIDPDRAPIIRKMFEKMAYDKWSGRKIYHWLKFEINFKSIGNHNLALSNIYRVLQNPFYYGVFEYPKKSGNWYQGKHEAIIDKELFDYLKEEELVNQLVKILDQIDFNNSGIQIKFEEELKRFNKFQRGVLGFSDYKTKHEDIDLKTYAKYILKEGTNEEKRELMGCFKSKIKITKGIVTIEN